MSDLNDVNENCKTKYPVLMVHGMGFRDRKHLCYWGRIPSRLKNCGAQVFFGTQDANASVEKNSEVLAQRVDEILAQTGAEKVNMIAHSKGGLEARYIASTLGYAQKIASISTINTPHNGSVTVDKLLKLPKFMVHIAAGLTDFTMRLMGDKDPQTEKCFYQLTTDYAERFNAENPDCGGVFYQSFGFKLKRKTSDILLVLPALVVGHFEGENDGMLAERAVRHTNFRGMYTSATNRGISHCDEVDARRMKFSGKPHEPFTLDQREIFDITEFYTALVEELVQKGL